MNTQMVVSGVIALLIVAAIVVGVLYATGVLGKKSSSTPASAPHITPGPHPYKPNPDGPVPHESGMI